ncbi:DUF4123 domain-containing protein [Endozoicomonas sp. SM1973]|uniref:DUF4123 domain-containing protein n=1 Tax=Spartinivicinus marinus TaxID=2994442 RepID=A0A853IGL9_9GAMM|nr:DUF4123 domain-containing protein [Spartinivicinus marinus]MCX4029293.1 DUF4123 domain-containing protein [Spartinivicinus marinus]NYZ69141.1 DUF4123 domain-containing protein [Spartinivicinus marinus]
MTTLDFSWPDLPCYLLLDTVREPSIKRWIYQHDDNPTRFSLYLMTKYKGMMEQSPELVKVERNSELWYSYLENGVKQHWGVVLFSDASFDEIVKHCQWWLQVQIHSGKPGLFRLYAPNLCEPILSQSTPQQLSYLLGIVQEFRCYADKWYQFKNPNPVPTDTRRILVLGDNQWQGIAEGQTAAYHKRLQNHINKNFPHLFKGKDNQQQLAWTLQLVKKAQEMKFTTVKDTFFFANVVGFLGADAMNSSLYPEIHQLLTKSCPKTPSQRIREAAILAESFATQQ